jgi:hypothetical protein
MEMRNRKQRKRVHCSADVAPLVGKWLWAASLHFAYKRPKLFVRSGVAIKFY